MAKVKGSNFLIRIIITLLGISFIVWSISTVLLGVIGERDTAVITNVRREGGERNDGKPGRYTYIISYTFKLPDGKSMDGFTRKISDGVYVKSPNTITSVRYLKAFPYLNVLEEETKPSLGHVVLLSAGGFLVYSMNARRSGGKFKFQIGKKVFK